MLNFTRTTLQLTAEENKIVEQTKATSHIGWYMQLKKHYQDAVLCSLVKRVPEPFTNSPQTFPSHRLIPVSHQLHDSNFQTQLL